MPMNYSMIDYGSHKIIKLTFLKDDEKTTLKMCACLFRFIITDPHKLNMQGYIRRYPFKDNTQPSPLLESLSPTAYSLHITSYIYAYITRNLNHNGSIYYNEITIFTLTGSGLSKQTPVVLINFKNSYFAKHFDVKIEFMVNYFRP